MVHAYGNVVTQRWIEFNTKFNSPRRNLNETLNTCSCLCGNACYIGNNNSYSKRQSWPWIFRSTWRRWSRSDRTRFPKSWPWLLEPWLKPFVQSPRLFRPRLSEEFWKPIRSRLFIRIRPRIHSATWIPGLPCVWSWWWHPSFDATLWLANRTLVSRIRPPHLKIQFTRPRRQSVWPGSGFGFWFCDSSKR